MRAALRGTRWFAQVKAWPITDVASCFGIDLVRRGADVSFVCPVCAKERRHKGDQRRAAKVTPDGGGWWCEPCGAKGDAVALAAVMVTGHLKPSNSTQWAEVHRKCAALDLCDADRDDLGGATGVRYVPPPGPVVAEVVPSRLPAAEVAALWAACRSLSDVPTWELPEDAKVTWPEDLTSDSTSPIGPPGWCGEARLYLSSRGYDVGWLAMLGLARVLPPADRAVWPSWWPSGWSQTWRLMVPLYDVTGELVALQARAIVPVSNGKTRNPLGAGVMTGTFFADALGLKVLGGNYKGPSLVVVEGLTDFLAAGQLVARLGPERRPAVLGIVAGSAREMARLTLAPSTRLIVLTDNDETGEKYFRQVADALPKLTGSRVRLPPIEGERADLNDYLKRYPNRALEALTYVKGMAPHGD